MIGERNFEALVAFIYEAGADFRRWPDALALMAEAYHAPAVVLGAYGTRAEDMWVVAPQIDAAQHARYAAHYHRINPIWRLSLPSATGDVLTDTMMIAKRDFARTEFFNDFLVPQDLGSMLGAVAHAEDGRQVSVVVQRARAFDAEEIGLHQRLAPHLQRAVQLNLRLAALEMRCAASAESLDQLDRGAFLVDAAGRVLFANREAESLTGAEGGLRLTDGILVARSTVETAKLHALLAGCGAQGPDAGTGGALALSRGADRSALTLMVVPLRSAAPAFLLIQRPVAIVFATDPDRRPTPPLARLRQRFGLTRAEARFAVEISKGDGIQASADRLRIAHATGRTHLAHIFQKTGTQRQAELVRLLLQG